MVCPVQGAVAFADTWGAPRSGGRQHQGVDMMAASGTTLVAVVSGSVNFKQTPLGGNSIWLTRQRRQSLLLRPPERVRGFQPLGVAGRGDRLRRHRPATRYTPHLHFEVHPGGGVAVDPYPYVRAVC